MIYKCLIFILCIQTYLKLIEMTEYFFIHGEATTTDDIFNKCPYLLQGSGKQPATGKHHWAIQTSVKHNE